MIVIFLGQEYKKICLFRYPIKAKQYIVLFTALPKFISQKKWRGWIKCVPILITDN